MMPIESAINQASGGSIVPTGTHATNPFSDLIPSTPPAPPPASGGTASTSTAGKLIPLKDRVGPHPRFSDYKTADGKFDSAAYNAAVHAWMYAPATGSTGSIGGGTTTTPTPATGGTTTPTTGGTTPAPMSQDDYTNLITKTPGYKFQVQQALDAVNTNAYLKGYANSGATGKALEAQAANVASAYYQQYLDNTYRLAALGSNATNALAGQANDMGSGVSSGLSGIGQAAQGAANGQINAANQQANAAGSLASGIGTGLGQIGNAIGSSYHPAAPVMSSSPIVVNPNNTVPFRY